MSQPIVNLADVSLHQSGQGERFAVQTAEIGGALGLKGLGCMLHVVPPGKTAYPFHRHHGCDEMFLILSGTGEYRMDEERLSIRSGDCLGAPAAGSAHQILNTGTEELRYLGFSNKAWLMQWNIRTPGSCPSGSGPKEFFTRTRPRSCGAG